MTSKRDDTKNSPVPELGGARTGDLESRGGDENHLSSRVRFQFTTVKGTKSTSNFTPSSAWTEAEETRLFELRTHYWHLIAEQAATEHEIKRLQVKRAAAVGEI